MDAQSFDKAILTAFGLGYNMGQRNYMTYKVAQDADTVLALAERYLSNLKQSSTGSDDICPSRDDAQKHIYENGICVFCQTKK